NCPLSCLRVSRRRRSRRFSPAASPQPPSKATTGRGRAAPTHHRAKADREGGVDVKRLDTVRLFFYNSILRGRARATRPRKRVRRQRLAIRQFVRPFGALKVPEREYCAPISGGAGMVTRNILSVGKRTVEGGHGRLPPLP